MITVEEALEIRDSFFRAVEFVQRFLPDPIDKRKIVTLTNSQIDAIDSIQFGFPIRHYTFKEIESPPMGVVMVWPRQTGKSYACAYAACALSFLEPGCRIGIISATDEQSKKLMKKIKRIVKNSFLKNYKINKTERKNFIEFVNTSEIECWPQTTGIEGSTYTYLFCDEAALMDAEIIIKSALPCVTHGKRWIMLSTPKGNKGAFIDFYYKGVQSRPLICRHCGQEYPQAAFNVDEFPLGEVPTEKMHDCVECGSRDYKYGIGRYAVPFVDPWNDGLRPKSWIKARLEEHEWSDEAKQEYLGRIVSGASDVFRSEWLEMCTNEKLKNVKPKKLTEDYVIGVDYGKKVDASCFYVTHKDKNNGKIILDFAMSIAGEFDYEKDYHHIRKDLLLLICHFNPMWVVPDATGLGDPLVEELERDLYVLSTGRSLKFNDLAGNEHVVNPSKRIRTKVYSNKNKDDRSKPGKRSKGFIISRTTKPDLIGNLIDLFANGRIVIPPKTEPEIDKLREELLRFESEWKPGTQYVKYGTQLFHDDRVIALALSTWGHRRKPWTLHEISFKGGGEYNMFDSGGFNFERRFGNSF